MNPLSVPKQAILPADRLDSTAFHHHPRFGSLHPGSAPDAVRAARRPAQLPANAAETMRDFSTAGLSELIQFIICNHHDFIRDELPRLHLLYERAIARRNMLNPELIELGRKFRRLSGDLTFHMSHTESRVFPYILALEQAKIHNTPLPRRDPDAESLMKEVMAGHVSAGESLRQIEIDTSGFAAPEDACPDLLGLYSGLKQLALRRSSHVHLEGFVLYPRALALEKEVLAA